MTKTYKAMKRREKEPFKIPRSVQQTIPIKKIWKDGVFQLTDRVSGLNQYSMIFVFSDINYIISSPSEKKKNFLKWESLLNSFESDARYKISVMKRRTNTAALTDTLAIPLNNDRYDKYRNILNEIVLNKAMAANGITQELYLTISIWKKDVESARTFFARQKTTLSAAFAGLSSAFEEVDAKERLRLFHDFYRQGEENDYNLDFADMRKQGADIRNYICPDTYSTDRHSVDHFMLGKKFGRALFLRTYATYIRDVIISQLCNINRPSCLSIDLVALPTDEAVNAAQNIKMKVEGNKNKYLRKAQERGNYAANITYDMQQQLEEADEFLRDLTERDQRVFMANVSMVHVADSLKELDGDTEEILASARKNMCQMATLQFEQLQGLITTLPYGVNRLHAETALTTEAISVFMPFKAQEVNDKYGMYCGTNAVTGNILSVNLDNLNNPNRFIVGMPGGGKSFGVKLNITELVLSTNADILILDPEREYTLLVEALGGQVIRLSSGSDDHINPMDMVDGYGEKRNTALGDKSEFLMSLFEQIDNKRVLGGDDKTIIDRCTSIVYENAKKDGTVPTLMDLKKVLEVQPEPQAQDLALTLELFTTGNLNTFAHHTNVDTNNRIICYDIYDLKSTLQTVGSLVVTDSLLNKVALNHKKGKKTYIFLDEFHVMLADEFTSDFFCSAWRRFRKRDASPCGITQNPDYLMHKTEMRTMLGNSTCVTMYQLAPNDIEIVADLYHLSAEQLKYVSDTVKPGNGLMKIGGSIVPFNGKFPKDNELYRLMTTKAGEWNG